MGWLFCCWKPGQLPSQMALTNSFAPRSPYKSISAAEAFLHLKSYNLRRKARAITSAAESQQQSVTALEDSMINVLQAALHRRKCTCSGNDLASMASAAGVPAAHLNMFLKDLVSRASSEGLRLDSCSAQDYARFIADWHAAAAQHAWRATDTGVALHEACLMQHLREPSALVWQRNPAGTAAPALADKASSNAGSVDTAAEPGAAASADVDTENAARTASGSSGASSGCRITSQELRDWKLFAAPPDIPVEPELIWAATMRSATMRMQSCSSKGSSKGDQSSDTCAFTFCSFSSGDLM